jgi:hypothetical protein
MRSAVTRPATAPTNAMGSGVFSATTVLEILRRRKTPKMPTTSTPGGQTHM